MAATALAVGVLACGQSAPRGGPGAAKADASGTFPRPERVAVMVLENRSFGQVIGSPKAPYINSLARRYALATKYYAIGHPSLPNYVALTGGAKNGIGTNCKQCDTEQPNLLNQLDAHGVDWRAYFEGLPKGDRLTSRTTRYNPFYNPFGYYERVSDPKKSRGGIVAFDRLRKDLASRRLQQFSWIAPNVFHDGHNHSLQGADRFASKLVPRVLRALGPNGVLYLTWDEGRDSDRAGVRGESGGGQVALIAAGGAARPGARIAVPANHYALLRTIEAGFGLPALRNAGNRGTPLLSGLLKSRRTAAGVQRRLLSTGQAYSPCSSARCKR